MFWVKFSLMILVWLLASPISLVCSIICRLGKPPALINYYATPGKGLGYNVKEWEESGDGPKFMGLGYFTTGRDDTWRFLSSLVRGGTIWRTPSLRDDLPVFSGDQMAGFALALHRRWKEGLLTPSELVEFKYAFDRIYFEGIPLVMENWKREWTFGRGWLWCPWEPCGGSSFAAAMTTSLLAQIFPDDKRYGYAAFILRMLSKVFLWSADFNFFFGRCYMLTMYAAHSLGCYAVLAMQLGYASGDYVMEQLHNRYPWNADFESDPDEAAYMRAATQAEFFKQAYTKKWFSIRSLRFKELAPTAVAPSQRLGTNHVWEGNPLEASPNSGNTQVEFIWQTYTTRN